MADERPQPTIIMTPPIHSSHPRRAPAHRSVSLLHSPRKRPQPIHVRSDSSSDSAVHTKDRASHGSPSSLRPLGGGSSGESSNAEKWFEQSNNEVRETTASFGDNEPPFFMRNSSSSETPPDVQDRVRLLHDPGVTPSTLPLRTGLLRLATDGSSTDDFRGVIDDLTIENNKLKRRLKKYEKLHDSHLRDEKLFEVRIHGLSAEKKRELEETLRKFASSLGTGLPSHGFDAPAPARNGKDAATSQTSVHNTDSAYASMTASAQGSSAQFGNDARHAKAGAANPSKRRNMNSSIHSYLHHIPEGLLPQPNPSNMSERTKRKLVVRRLEHIFAGKRAADGGHQHSLQQQDVSQMAARADRVATEQQGHRSGLEGTREAHIMLGETEDITEQGTGLPGTALIPVDEHGNQHKAANTTTRKTAPKNEDLASSEQRPTRPLDLDLHRAQVPEDNIRYMRHLGFSPPDASSRDLPEEGHGWIYLNLLMNMAQLHTINVTAEFVRKALSDHSSKFELSQDGRKARWKGGRSVTRTSSNGDNSSSQPGADTSDGISPRKRPKLTHRTSGKSGMYQPGTASGSRSLRDSNKLVYTPLFFHRDSTDDADNSSVEDDSSSSPLLAPRAAGDSSAMTSSIVPAASTRKSSRNDGPIIFYNNARFCTDLSGDHKVTGNANAPPYVTVSQEPVGKPWQTMSGDADGQRGPLASASTLPEPMDFEDNPIPKSLELSFPQRSPVSADRRPSIKPLEMEVTGIGGVWPSDNFVVSVESRQAVLGNVQTSDASQGIARQHVSHKLGRIMKGPDHKTHLRVRNQIVATSTKVLPPSRLPPALSFMPFAEDSQDDDETDPGDVISLTPESPGALPPSAAPQPVDLHYISSDEDYDDDDDDDDDESDCSLDLLAAARELDPDAIRAQELEYDANMAERLAEEIPAGSSAATAGGGSGFASPADAMTRDEYERALKAIRARAAGGRKPATTDSVKVQNATESPGEDEDDVMDDVAL